MLGLALAGLCGRARAADLTHMHPRGGAMSVDLALNDWESFRSRFVTPEGRVVDTDNGGVSHSEAQAFGLLMAVRFNDRPTFERIYAWSILALRRPNDTLLAWRYQPSASPPVQDLNTAADGDIVVAWALQQAGLRWGQANLTRRATAMTQDILRRCVLISGDRVLLLPGAEGFVSADRIVVNLSYYIFPALADLSALVPDPAWARLIGDGLLLLRQSRFGRWELPPDWLELPRGIGRPRIAGGWPSRFSFDAVRVPLNLVWGGLREEQTVAAAARFWLDPDFRDMPAWVDLRNGSIAHYPASPGVRAVAQLSLAAVLGRGRHAALPRVHEASQYYAALLTMCAHFAWEDAGL